MVFRPEGEGDLCKVLPTCLHAQITSAANGNPVSHKFVRSGALTAETTSDAAVSKLLELTELGKIKISTNIASSYLRNTALTKRGPEYYSEKDLKETLPPRGVTHVHRRTRAQETENSRSSPGQEIVVQFADNTQRPRKLSFGFCSCKVREFTQAPPRFYRCQKFGHLAANCKAHTEHCSHCCGSHTWRDCAPGTPAKCANCQDPQPARNPRCPTCLAAI